MYNYRWTEEPSYFSFSLLLALCFQHLPGTHARSVFLHKTLSQSEGTSHWLPLLEPGRPHPCLSWSKNNKSRCDYPIGQADMFFGHPHLLPSKLAAGDEVDIFCGTQSGLGASKLLDLCFFRILLVFYSECCFIISWLILHTDALILQCPCPHLWNRPCNLEWTVKGSK